MSNRRFSFMIDPILSARLKAVKARLGTSESELIRRALEQWLEGFEWPASKPPRPRELSQHL